MTRLTCATCRFFRPKADKEYPAGEYMLGVVQVAYPASTVTVGRCVRRAPSVTDREWGRGSAGNAPHATWPVVHDYEDCGEHEPAEDA